MRFLQKHKWLFALLTLQVAIHLPYMNRVAMGNHVWRQVNTLAVAKNYYEKDMNILYPRIDKNYGTNGITGPQFTSYYYSVALIYKVFGFSETAHRWFSLLLSLCAIAGTIAIIRLYLPRGGAPYWGGLALIGIPEFYYYSIAAVPDLLALAAMVWGWWWFYQFLNRPSAMNLIFSMLLLALAGMTKLMFLVPGFVFLGEIIRRKAWNYKELAGYSALAIGVLGTSAWWYFWAKYLTDMNGINEFVHAIRFKESVSAALQALVKNMGIDTVETWVGYPLLIPVFGGLFFTLKRHARYLRVIFTLLAALLYYVVMQHQLEHHGYYMVLFVPFIALSAAYFVHVVHRRSKASPENFFGMSKWHIFLVLAPIWSVLRMSHNFNLDKPGMPIAFVDSESRDKMQQFSQAEDLWIVGPDQSGCVYFYYLGAKGFPWYNLQDKSTEFSRFKSMGAKGIITDSESEAREFCSRENLKIEWVHRYKNWVWLRFI